MIVMKTEQHAQKARDVQPEAAQLHVYAAYSP